ncbi:MAG: glucose-6-phosphate isomerase [Uliginosibacterium sp.]|nr:glucose-6-phosphate isomerase [Uliginosibacterium sp.]
MNPTSTSAWSVLSSQTQEMQATHMRDMFEKDPSRAQRLCTKACGIYLDYSKNRLTDAVLDQLVKLAEETGVPAHARKMFAGEKINNTEKRAVLHTALRNMGDTPVMVGGQNVIPEVREVRERTYLFARRVRSGEWRGFTGQAITDVVNIGIGGSDLGPLMIVEALKPLADGPRLHFVSNVDSLHLNQTLKDLDPERTLFIVASKTFTTIETLTNARSARAWLLNAAKGDKAAIARHFVAVSTNAEKVSEFGIDLENMFGFWDWVGGRYSLWSSIGLPIAVAIGPEGFNDLLAGAYDMDLHFQNAPIRENLPYLLALLGIWYNNFLGASSHVVAPYNQTLHRLPAFLQQLDMESNGKSVRAEGEPVHYATGPVIWGEPGTNGQHAFFQLLHQGTSLIPVDFILALKQPGQMEPHRTSQIANCLAQASALMQGKTQAEVQTEMRAKGVAEDQIAALLTHREFKGNRPSNMMLLDDLSPRTLGALIALYEHKVFVQGAIWGLNSFDQWGVELGKQLATGIEQRLGAEDGGQAYDASTEALINYVRTAKP